MENEITSGSPSSNFPFSTFHSPFPKGCGRLIVLEGIDGSGKTTQLNLMCDELTRRGVAYRKLEFPRYADESSALVRMYLSGVFGGDPDAVNAYAASSLYAVDRFASYMTDWGKGYESGELFVAGRYTTSNAIHQGAKLDGAARRVYMDWLFDYEYRLLGLPAPDAVIYLDVTPEIAARNIASRGDRRDIHEGDPCYISRCRDAALFAAANYGWRVVNCCRGAAMRPVSEIHAAVMEILF